MKLLVFKLICSNSKRALL